MVRKSFVLQENKSKSRVKSDAIHANPRSVAIVVSAPTTLIGSTVFFLILEKPYYLVSRMFTAFANCG